MNDKIKDNLVYIRHILDAINAIQSYTKGMNVEKFKKDAKTIDAVVRQFEIIGEATKHIALSFKEQHKKIEWQKMISMRNFLAHEYLKIDMNIIWDTACKHLPELKNLLKPLVH